MGIRGRRAAEGNHVGVAYQCFEYAARTLGLNDAHIWFTTPNYQLNLSTPSEALASGQAVPVLTAARLDSPFEAVPLTALDTAGIVRVSLAGDWHGNLGHALASIERLGKMGIRTILHLGDWGLWPGPPGIKYVRRVNKACEQHDITILVTDGNHDNHARLAAIEPIDGIRWITDRIGFFERGRRWTWAGTTFVSLGGAPSVNKANLTAHKTWWPGEVPTHLDLAKAITGGPVDVMLTHDAPAPATRAVERIIRDNPQKWPEEALEYAAEGRARVTVGFQALQPRLLAHGHSPRN